MAPSKDLDTATADPPKTTKNADETNSGEEDTQEQLQDKEDDALLVS